MNGGISRRRGNGAEESVREDTRDVLRECHAFTRSFVNHDQRRTPFCLVNEKVSMVSTDILIPTIHCVLSKCYEYHPILLQYKFSGRLPSIFFKGLIGLID